MPGSYGTALATAPGSTGVPATPPGPADETAPADAAAAHEQGTPALLVQESQPRRAVFTVLQPLARAQSITADAKSRPVFMAGFLGPKGSAPGGMRAQRAGPGAIAGRPGSHLLVIIGGTS